MSGAVTPMAGYAVYTPGETLHVEVSGGDNRELEWLGYALGAPALERDSFPVDGATATLSRNLHVQSAWAGRVEVRAFARDVWGNIGEKVLDTIAIVKGVRRPLRSVPLAAPVYDIGYDDKRSRLYLSQPLAQQIAVLALPAGVYQPPIVLLGTPWGFDLTLSGDSLLVALRRSHYLAFVNLVSGAIDTLRLDLPNFLLTGPANVRIMANAKALLTITCNCVGFAYRMWEYDLTSGVVRERSDQSPVSETSPLIRGADRQRMLALMDNGCCPVQAWVYESAIDSFTVLDTTVSRYFPPISTDATASRFLIGTGLFDPALHPLGILQVPDYNDGPTTITPDGNAAYLTMDHGYVKARIPDSAVLERVLLPLNPDRLLVLPDGETMVATTIDPHTGEHRLWLVDLR